MTGESRVHKDNVQGEYCWTQYDSLGQVHLEDTFNEQLTLRY